MGPQAILWFVIGAGALIFAFTLLYRRYIAKSPDAIRSRGAFTMFAGLMVLFAIGAFVAGFAALDAGR
jgi:vacuolar-type H+-ATPase subunit I/STV1